MMGRSVVVLGVLVLWGETPCITSDNLDEAPPAFATEERKWQRLSELMLC